MKTRFWRSKWFVAILAIVILSSTLTLFALRIDFGTREDAVLQYFSKQDGMPETFAQLEQLTPPDSMVLCWWDYG